MFYREDLSFFDVTRVAHVVLRYNIAKDISRNDMDFIIDIISILIDLLRAVDSSLKKCVASSFPPQIVLSIQLLRHSFLSLLLHN